MPTIKEAIAANRDNLTPIEPTVTEKKTPPDIRVDSLLQNRNRISPLPPSNNSADSLRQWGQGSDVPRFRTQTPPSNIAGSGSGSTTVIEAASSGSTAPSKAVLPTAASVNVKTPVLAPSATWTGSVQMAKGFLVLAVSANSFARIELYGTKAGQTLDLPRPVTQGPANTTISLILDVALLSSLSWQVLDCVGANADSPQSATIYITITNLSTGTGAISASISYVPQES
jgi:hypothetical protein